MNDTNILNKIKLKDKRKAIINKKTYKFKYGRYKVYTKGRYPMEFERVYNSVCEYGRKVEKLRKSLNISLRQMAKSLSISHRALSKIEKGECKKINLEIMSDICERFHVSYPYMLGKSTFTRGCCDYYCFPNPLYNFNLWEFISSKEIFTKRNTEVFICEKMTPKGNKYKKLKTQEKISLYHPIGSVLRYLKKHKGGMMVIHHEYYKYYLYYFTADEFRIRNPKLDFKTITDSGDFTYSIHRKHGVEKQNEKIKFLYPGHIASLLRKTKNKFKYIVVIHECVDLIDPLKNYGYEDNTMEIYEDMIVQLFRSDVYYKTIRKSLLEFLFNAAPILDDNKIIELLTDVAKHDNYGTKTLRYLLGIIHDFMKIPENSQTEVYKGIAAYLRKATKDLENDF